MEPGFVVRGRYGVVLAGMGDQLRPQPSADSGRGDDQQRPGVVAASAELGASPLPGLVDRSSSHPEHDSWVAGTLEHRRNTDDGASFVGGQRATLVARASPAPVGGASGEISAPGGDYLV